MPLHRMIADAISSATAASLWATSDLPKVLDRAAHADNTASALKDLREVQADLLILQHRVKTAVELCECALKDDENVPPIGTIARTLSDGLKPQLHRFSRADLRVIGK